ncbi:uncharacterized protein LOC129571040 [Sitodiplosis mosellana]|uniref:uncharacterized protein LOC129571040 n=1 Tax=Sitodiplosis mosellana TaxID=263140 RepID=UPI002443B9F7|nr:uncharacterized protein LOC129571040 [Sitodiplosis mosellana]XP_055306774.1 uncharacterized protein LOC129571040 [Sitodiplosis mosellana]XP_055306776.1 uncharacterized protein LOC129571040 [Sitodiplosis mosellana]XP_055306777.1 uncharacterized protein LOC129571040 [Sitodiplosis mosellana]XP_055306778.1 uncharacterized protein LOC129571040 [Sitodiplosis mosellana]
MDSFAQQMLNEIDRRCKIYQLSNSSISLKYECNKEENQNESDNIPKLQEEVAKNELKDVEFHTKESGIEMKDHMKTEMVYANSNVIRRSEVESSVKTISVPLGRKPALPPKPPKRLELKNARQKGFVHNACAAIFDRMSPPDRKDPAEMSLKERLALFEKKNKVNTFIPKMSQDISTSGKQLCARNTEDQIMAPLISSATIVENKFEMSSSIMISTRTYEDESNGKSKSTVYELTSEVCDKQLVGDLRSKSRKKQTPVTGQLQNIMDGTRSSLPKSRPPPPPSKSNMSNNVKVSNPPKKEDSHVEVNCSLNNRRSGETCATSALYGDLTRIVTTIAPTKMKPDETIGLNDLHQSGPNCTLLSESNQYQTKEEDRWDKFIECLLFFCCVA